MPRDNDRDETVTWSTSTTHRRRRSRRLPLLLLMLPLVLASFGGPVGTVQTVHGDELSNARSRQTDLRKQIATNRAKIAKLASLQGDLSAAIRDTRSQLAGLNDDLDVVRGKIKRTKDKIAEVRAAYNDLVDTLKQLDAQLIKIQGQEDAKRAQLADRKRQLAERIRSAYDTDRTSMLETFLSGGTFTDLLSEISYYIDVGEQDKALAQQIAKDQETLAALHETVEETRAETDEVRVATAKQKRSLDAAMLVLKKDQAVLKRLELAAKRTLARQRHTYQLLSRNKAAARRALAAAARAERALASKIRALIRRQASQGRIPSQYNGTLRWPMNGVVSQNFGCTGFPWEGPKGDCAHFHEGIDIVAPYGRAVRSAGSGTVVFVGFNPYDAPPQAFIVIVAHSSGLQTWYAHLQPRYPVHVGQHVSSGTVIGYEGMTGHTTGAHLHWAVMQNGEFVNPRLFL
ncbi:MAG: murein hydrolase activator EnvC family protein [Chloroflexota bacterium]